MTNMMSGDGQRRTLGAGQLPTSLQSGTTLSQDTMDREHPNGTCHVPEPAPLRWAARAPAQHLEAAGLLSRPTADGRYGGVAWPDLYGQKLSLLKLLGRRDTSDAEGECLEGLLNFLDCLTDAAENIV